MGWLNKISLKRFFKRKSKVVKRQVPSMANALGRAGIGVEQLAKTGSEKNPSFADALGQSGSKKKPGRPRKIDQKKRGRPRNIHKKQ